MPRLSENDPSSFSTPATEVITHVDLDWTVNFDEQCIDGVAELHFKILAPFITNIILDVDGIKLKEVNCKCEAGNIPLMFNVDSHTPGIGSKLTVELPTKTSDEIILSIAYSTGPSASGLQWLTANQTSGKKHPFLFSQCQPIYARSLLPCQDTPSVKFTYKAKLRYPVEVTGLMSAIATKRSPGYAEFEQTVPIESYLIAIAVGELVSKDLSPISSVWAEKEVIDAAAWEFAGTPNYLEKAVQICGEYVWKRYDLLVMPPSFPYGGMENPCMTFVTPTLIAGDRSLADVVAHEIAHSWTGNLVTNRNFEHFWLNEGFTVFVEGKIVGAIEGPLYRDFHTIRGLAELKDCISQQLKDTPELQKLVVDLSDCTPDDAFSSIPYIKGSTFLRYMEDVFGGPDVFGPFFKFYLDKFKYKSIVTDDFKKTVWEYFSDPKYEEALSKIDWDLWLYGTGMPPHLPKLDHSIEDEALQHVDLWRLASLEDIKKSSLLKEKLSSQQILQVLSKLIEHNTVLEGDKMALLEDTYKVNETKNAEIRFYYLRLCIRAKDLKKLPAIFEFADSSFRMKFVRPIYRELAAWDEVKDQAIAHFEKMKDQMMKMVSVLIAKDMGIS